MTTSTLKKMVSGRKSNSSRRERVLYIPEDKYKEHDDLVWEVCQKVGTVVARSAVLHGVIDIVLHTPELKEQVINEIVKREKSF
ncbi:TPA: hypothetical protein LC260_004687 [Salmonella enterica subsp. enterica serovar Eastbourne]|nr:hypothetical protein [Salmonella enterica]HBJ6378606.1 hypothetical protein [Salmonella enterica subsp. enterica serovar Eastbourne]